MALCIASRRMPCRLKFQQAAVVVNIGVFGLIPICNSIQNEEPIDLRCSGIQLAMVSEEVVTVAIHRFDLDVFVHDLRL